MKELFPLSRTIPAEGGKEWESTRGPGFCDPVNRRLHIPTGATPGDVHIRVHELTHAYISPAGARRPADMPDINIQRAEDARCNAFARQWGIADLLAGVCSDDDVRRLTKIADTDNRCLPAIREAITAAVSVQATGDQPAMTARIRGLWAGEDQWIADRILAFAESAAAYMDRSARQYADDPMRGWNSSRAVAIKAERWALALSRDIETADQPPEQPEQQPEQGGEDQQPEQQPGGEDQPQQQQPGDDAEQQPGSDDPEQDGNGEGEQDAATGDPQPATDDEAGNPGEAPGKGDADAEQPAESADADALADMFGDEPADDADGGEGASAQPQPPGYQPPEVPVEIAPPVGGGAGGPDGAAEVEQRRGNDAIERSLEALEKYRDKYAEFDKTAALSGKGVDPFDMWIEARITRPRLPLRLPPKLRGRRLRATDAGAVVRYANRDESDGQIFAERGQRFGGATVLIDCSSSTSMKETDVERILAEAPAATVATYAGKSSTGEIRIVAKDGRRAIPGQVMPGVYIDGKLAASYRINACDGPALDWLNSQPGPRYWVSDGQVNGKGGPSVCQIDDAISKCRRGKVMRLDTVRGLLEALAERKIKRRK